MFSFAYRKILSSCATKVGVLPIVLLGSCLLMVLGAARADRIGVNVNGLLYGTPVVASPANNSNRQTVSRDDASWAAITAKVGLLSDRDVGVIRVPVDFDLLFMKQMEMGAVLDRIRSLAIRTQEHRPPIYVAPVIQVRTQDSGSHVVRFRDAPFRRQFEGALRQLGEGLLAIDPDRFLLEVLNEPEYCGEEKNIWNDLQLGLYRRLREKLPQLNIVLSGSCWSRWDMFLHLDLRPYAADRRTYFTFHYYDPEIFTFQNQPWSKFYFKYTDGISLVRECNARGDPRKAVIHAIEAAQELTVGEKKSLSEDFDRTYADFSRGEPWDERLRRQFAAVRDKAIQSGIDPSRIFLGEFGVFKGSTKDPALSLDRLYWAQTVRDQAVANGFQWAYWAAVGVGFGIWDSWATMNGDEHLLAVLAGREHVARRACKTE